MWWQALLDFLRAIWPSLVGASKLILAGAVARKITQGKAAENELASVDEAMRMAVVNSTRTVAERLRDAKKRGLYRVPCKPPVD
jgi:hypothetical protein